MARKVIGIGETILDILFKNNQPTAAVPGGSVFNGIISLGRMGVNVDFISETGNDKVGNIILDFMKEDFVKNDSAETMDLEEEHQNSETMEPAEPAPEQQNSDSSGYGF